MKTALQQLGFLLAGLGLIGIIGGGSYAYVQIRANNQGTPRNTIIDLPVQAPDPAQIIARLAEARASVITQRDALTLIQNSPSSPEALAVARERVLDRVEAVIKKTDSVVQDIKKANPSAQTTAQLSLLDQIAADRAHLDTVLDQWKTLVDQATAAIDAAAAAKAAAYAAEVQKYIDELQHLVQQLTPGNSGLTPEEIAHDQSVIAAAVADANQAATILEQPTVPPSVVQQQQQVVNDAQTHVSDLLQQLVDATNPPSNPTQDPGSTGEPPSSNASSSPDGGTAQEPDLTSGTPGENVPGTRYVPPIRLPDPNKPKLIEGANPGQ